MLLIPVSAVVIWSASTIYEQQLQQLQQDATRLAATIAAHVDQTDAAEDQFLRDFVKAIPLPDGSIVRVEDDRGNVLVRHQAGPAYLELEARLGASRTTRHPWTVTVGLPTALAQDRTSAVYRRMILISGVATVVLLIMEAWFARRFLRSFFRLERAADRVGAGDLSTPAREPMPTRELEHLRDAFREMVVKLRDAREAIARQVEEERRMRREVESLQQQVIRQERLAAIGLLLSGIAHELNNPLQAISGFAELLQRDRDVRPDVRADLALIQKESARASGIIRNLSRFSRQQHSVPTTVLLGDVVSSVIELRQRRLQEQGVTFEIEERATRPVVAVLTELQQVVLNFVVNAEQAVAAAPPSERRIRVRTSDTADGVMLEVEDSGPGVPPEHEAKLFQPFFTTKPVGEGTGLGLSVSYGIVHSFGGTIGYSRSSLGGARFYFELPPLETPPRT
ncbi:MAG TPA: ATP-binding protein [Vicinamibacterales bacterium]|nr:ATP-binding protein [Vicinamibacterales bacterium]